MTALHMLPRQFASAPVCLASILHFTALLLAGCGDNRSGPSTVGSLRVVVETSGADIDADGYTVTVGGSTRTISANGSITVNDLQQGAVGVELSGVATNCEVDGSNPRNVTVAAGSTVETAFHVNCTGLGLVRVTVETTGQSIDPDGYTVHAGSFTLPIPANGEVTLEDLLAGSIEVELSGVASNCEVEGPNPRAVTVVAEATVETAFRVVCSPTTWTTIRSMPTSRLGLATAVADGVLYAIGGYEQSNAPGLTTVEAYDPQTDTWTQRETMPTGRRWFTAAAVNGKIYAIGGHTGVGEPGLPTVEEYDPATDSWTEKAKMPTARLAATAAVVGDRIYVVGGTSDNQTVIPTMEEYDPATDTWTLKAPMPTARALVSLEEVGGKLYAIGGGGSPASGNSTVEVYEPGTDSWTTGLTPMPTLRSSACSGVVDGRIYVIGGAAGGIDGTVYGTTEEYDPATDTWSPKVDMPTPRAGLSCDVVDGKIYALGGAPDYTPPHPGRNSAEVFDPSIP